MEREIYRQMAEVEAVHWWFAARRQILSRMIDRLALPRDAEIFEAGCGTGGNLAMLSAHGQVVAMEFDAQVRTIATQRQGGTVQSGVLPDQVPFAGRCFDLIVLFDVLEHLDQDQETLQVLRSRLKPGGQIMVTVPAYGWLWSKHDESHHHKRRYRRRSLRRVAQCAGLQVTYISYFNTLLFPLIAGIRLLQKALGQQPDSNLGVPTAWLNGVLQGLFASERYALGAVALPFGVSLLMLAQPDPVAVSSTSDMPVGVEV